MSSKFHERANGDARRSRTFRNKWQKENGGEWKKNRHGWVWLEPEVKAAAPSAPKLSPKSWLRKEED